MSYFLRKEIGACIALCFVLSTSASGQNTASISLAEVIQTTLSLSPEIKLQEQAVVQAQADIQMATGLFDYQAFGNLQLSQDRRNVLPLPIPTDFDRILRDTFGVNTVVTNQASLSGGVSRQFRNGFLVQSSIGTGRVLNDIPFPSPFEQFTSQNATSLRLQVAIPLLKNRGGLISQSSEIAATQLLGVAEKSYSFAISSQVFRVVMAYWNYQTVYRSFSSYQQAEERAKQVLEDSRLLIEAEKKPMADLAQIEADLALKTSNRLTAFQTLFEARQNLGRAMGLEYGESSALGTPTDHFPTLKTAGNPDSLQVADLLPKVLQGRPDLQAQEQLIEVRQTLMAAAKQNLLPKLDANVFLQQAGLQYGNNIGDYLRPFSASEGRTIDYGGSISLVVPLQNNVAKGSFKKEKAYLMQEQINYENQLRQIQTDLSIAINQVKISKEVLLQSQITYDKSKETFENEQVKYQRGLTTLLNLIIFQERLTSAELNYIQAQRQFAMAIALLRFESGTIQDGSIANPAVFFSIPTGIN